MLVSIFQQFIFRPIFFSSLAIFNGPLSPFLVFIPSAFFFIQSIFLHWAWPTLLWLWPPIWAFLPLAYSFRRLLTFTFWLTSLRWTAMLKFPELRLGFRTGVEEEELLSFSLLPYLPSMLFYCLKYYYLKWALDFKEIIYRRTP